MKRDQIHDYYFLKAKKENFSARSVYKLQEIQSKYKVINSGDKVLDLGCAPGSWCEYSSELLGPSGLLCAIDLLPLSPSAVERIKRSRVDFRFHQGSILEDNPFKDLIFDTIISDMAPNTNGNRLVDTQGSLELIEMAFSIIQKQLKEGGNFIAKLFQSNETVDATRCWKKHFKIAKLSKPAAVRKESKELYFVGIGYSLD